MYKNKEIARFLKEGLKKDKVFIEKKGEDYYISDSVAIYKVREENFEKIPREVIPRLPEKGEVLQYSRRTDPYRCNLKPCDLLRDLAKKKEREFKITSLFFKVPGLSCFVPIFQSEKGITLLQQKYLDIFEELWGLSFYSTGQRATEPLIVYKYDSPIAALMPLNMESIQAAGEALREVAGVVVEDGASEGEVL